MKLKLILFFLLLATSANAQSYVLIKGTTGMSVNDWMLVTSPDDPLERYSKGDAVAANTTIAGTLTVTSSVTLNTTSGKTRILGSLSLGDSVTIPPVSFGSSHTYTIPDAGANAQFVLLSVYSPSAAASQTIPNGISTVILPAYADSVSITMPTGDPQGFHLTIYNGGSIITIGDVQIAAEAWQEFVYLNGSWNRSRSQ